MPTKKKTAKKKVNLIETANVKVGKKYTGAHLKRYHGKALKKLASTKSRPHNQVPESGLGVVGGIVVTWKPIPGKRK